MSRYYTKQAIRKMLEEAGQREKNEMRNEIRAVEGEEAVQITRLITYGFMTLGALFTYFVRKAVDRQLQGHFGKI